MHYVLLAEEDNARAAPVAFLSQSLGDQDVQGLTHGSLGHAELAGPHPFDDSLSGRDFADQDLLAKEFGEVLFDQLVSAHGGALKCPHALLYAEHLTLRSEHRFAVDYNSVGTQVSLVNLSGPWARMHNRP